MAIEAVDTRNQFRGQISEIVAGPVVSEVVVETGIETDVSIVHLLGMDAEPALARGDISAFAAQIELGPFLASKG